MIRKLQFFILLIALPFSANAALLTFQSAWQYQLHPSAAGISGTGLFTFTVDDTTPIASISGESPFQNAVYSNAITSATFILGDLTLYLDGSRDNGVGIYNKDRSGGVDASISAFLLDEFGAGYKIILGFEMGRDLTSLSLSNLDGLNNEDNPGSYIDPDTCTVSPFVCGYSLRQIGFQTAVPLPAGVWLFASGIIGLFVCPRFKTRKNQLG